MVKINNNEQLDWLINYLLDERDEKIDIPNDYNSKKALLRSLMNIRPPEKISSEFLEIQDEFLRGECESKILTSPEEISEAKGRILLWQGDITTLKVDAIVNAANSKLLGCFMPNHNCIDNIIHSSAGVQLRDECNKIMTQQGHDEKIGDAKITSAYNLPSKHVIHTVGPAIRPGLQPSKLECEQLKNCYLSCLEIADAFNLESVAFCCISTGVFNFPKDKACEIAVKTVGEYLKSESNLKYVIFDVFEDEDYLIYKKELFGE